MSEIIKENSEISKQTFLLIDCQIKIGAILNLLIKNNVFTEIEFNEEIESLSKKIAEEMVKASTAN